MGQRELKGGTPASKSRDGSDRGVNTGEAARPLLVYVQGLLPSMNPTERLIAEYVLVDPERILSSSIAEVRDGSGASVGSIVAFCRSLGMKGFADFKIALARDMAQSGLPGIGSGGGAQNGSLFEKVFQFHAQGLAETARINSEEALDSAARALERAHRIQLFAVGISYPVAYLASCKFQLIGLAASAHFDSHMQTVGATQLRRGDVGFGISCSGQTREPVHCLEIAKSKGAVTICLTNSVKSAITAHAGISLFATPSEVKYFEAPLASRVTQLAVLDALFVSIAQRNKERTAIRLRDTGKELLKQRIT
jgi:RpiR family transcriptional regulator, carbohydrate utilization regulator